MVNFKLLFMNAKINYTWIDIRRYLMLLGSFAHSSILYTGFSRLEALCHSAQCYMIWKHSFMVNFYEYGENF